jgi:caspase domain-containing protein
VTVQRRALLIGSQTHGLEGVEADVERMGQALSARHFELTRCTGAAATRDGILAAYERLIVETQPNDAVCIYYSGHGGRVANSFAAGPRFLQYLVPTDHGPGSFRGLMSFELSALLAKLTARTANVTLILDCCHAGQMSRGKAESSFTAKAVSDELSEQQLEPLVNRARAQPLSDAESNPLAIRLLATEPHVSAYEEKRDGVASGVFTAALLSVLAERSDRRASWGSVMLKVRELVMQRKAEQRPDVEGPRRRLLFELLQSADERPLALFFEGPDAILRGGGLQGAVPGSRFGVMPADSESYSPDAALGEAVVIDSLGSTSRVELRAAEHRRLPSNGLLAFPLSVPFQKCRVGLGPELSPELVGLIADSRYFAPEPIQAGMGLPTVRRRDGELVLLDASGLLLARALESQPGPLLERLECLARAEDLRAFPTGTLKVRLRIELGRVEQGQTIEAGQGEAVHVGDRQYISVMNTGYDKRYVAVLGIDPKYSVRLLSRRAPRGQMLRPDQPLTLGQSPNGDWLGLTATWPDGLATDQPRLETLLVIAAEDEQDFSQLTTSDAYDFKLCNLASNASAPSPRGGPRAARTPRAPRSEYAIQRIDYQLVPQPRGG